MVATFLVCAQARAGQTAPRLAGLFEELRFARYETEPACTRLWLQASESQRTQQLAEAKKEIESYSYDKAMKMLDVLVVRAPQFAETWNLRATLHYIERDYDASLADVDRTLALEPHHFGALAGLGEIRRKQGELGGALSAFKRAFAVHPYFPQAKVRVSALRERLREQ